MKPILTSTLLFAVATSAAGKSTSASESTACAAKNIVDQCLTTTKAYLDGCNNNDFGCLCDKWTAVVTCYNNCPDDSRMSGDKTQKDNFCSLAKQYDSTSSAPVASKTAGSTATATSDSHTTATPTDGEGSSTNGVAKRATSSSGLLVALAGVLAAFL